MRTIARYALDGLPVVTQASEPHPGFSTNRGSWLRNAWRLYVVAAVAIYSTSLSWFLGEGNRNLLLIGFMGLAPLLLKVIRIQPGRAVLYCFALSVSLGPVLLHPVSVRWSTVLYTLMFIGTFMVYEGCLQRSHLSKNQLAGVIKIMMFAHLCTLLVQQACVALGLPIFNSSNYSALEPWKLNMLASEPSHAARIICILMYSYLALSKNKLQGGYTVMRAYRQDRWLWAGFMWACLTAGSATALILAAVVAQSLSSKRSWGAFLAATATLAVVAPIVAPSSVSRVLALAQGISTWDYYEVLLADHSGAMRIAPFMILTEKVSLFSFAGLFGHGIDSVGSFLSDYVFGVEQGASGGGILQLWYEYGFIAFALFGAFCFTCGRAYESLDRFAMFVAFVVFSGPNNQFLWLYLILMTSIDHFSRRREAVQWHFQSVNSTG